MAGSDGRKGRYLVAAPEKCTGCRVCEMICSLKYEAASSPRLSRIRVVKVEEWNRNYPTACKACTNPPCVGACPTGACYPAPQGAGVRVDSARCIGCGDCLLACPFGAVALHPETGVALICDLCDGQQPEPACVANCLPGALRLVSPDELAQEKRRAWALAARR
jgi:carbon-monoxide dehydrogenase iron sulfur subunit